MKALAQIVDHNGHQREARSSRAGAVPILFAVEPTDVDEGLARLGETLARVSDPTHAGSADCG